MSDKAKRDERGVTGRPELTEVEWDIMRVVWKEQPCAAGTVQETLHEAKQWAYSTVKTTMDRMVQKGLLTVSRIRNLQLFSAAITEAEARRGELLKIVKRAFNGALTPMLQFLIEDEELSQTELSELRKVIDAKRKG